MEDRQLSCKEHKANQLFLGPLSRIPPHESPTNLFCPTTRIRSSADTTHGRTSTTTSKTRTPDHADTGSATSISSTTGGSASIIPEHLAASAKFHCGSAACSSVTAPATCATGFVSCTKCHHRVAATDTLAACPADARSEKWSARDRPSDCASLRTNLQRTDADSESDEWISGTSISTASRTATCSETDASYTTAALGPKTAHQRSIRRRRRRPRPHHPANPVACTLSGTRRAAVTTTATGNTTPPLTPLGPNRRTSSPLVIAFGIPDDATRVCSHRS